MRRRAFKQWAGTCSLGLGTRVTNKVHSTSQHFSKAMIGQNSLEEENRKGMKIWIFCAIAISTFLCDLKYTGHTLQ